MIESVQLKSIDGIRHGWFTRRGGHSTGLFSSLNCGYGSGDDRSVVAMNRAAAARRLGVKDDRLLTVYQVHSDRVVAVEGTWKPEDAVAADAMVTDVPGIGLGVLTADCAPVLFASRDGRCIGAAHAGWKGALAGVTDTTIAAMEKLGARRSDIIALIGPTISRHAYEVGAEFRARFLAAQADNDRWFTASPRADYFMFDLPGYIADRLRRAGIAGAADLGYCTYSDEASYFSFRRATHRDQKDYGRLLSAIAIDH
ncbi:MAG: peptidoglycan editing factor PgeF [Pseudomonadota bacterium]|nr:peptidoglycan editing factor PgeF [Pseudomonadota bacterium]